MLPVGITGVLSTTFSSPRRMIAPLPCAFSIVPSARLSAFSRFGSMAIVSSLSLSLPFVVWLQPVPRETRVRAV